MDSRKCPRPSLNLRSQARPRKPFLKGFTPPDMIPLSGDPRTTGFLVSHANTSLGQALTWRWLLLRCLVKFMVGLLLPNQHTSISGLYPQSKKPLFYIPHKTWSPTLCQADVSFTAMSRMAVNERPWDQSVRDANDHTGSSRQTAAGASGAT